MPRRLTWYFDVISPYAYLQTGDLHRLPADAEIVAKPVLFDFLGNPKLFEGAEMRRHGDLPMGAISKA